MTFHIQTFFLSFDCDNCDVLSHHYDLSHIYDFYLNCGHDFNISYLLCPYEFS